MKILSIPIFVALILCLGLHPHTVDRASLTFHSNDLSEAEKSVLKDGIDGQFDTLGVLRAYYLIFNYYLPKGQELPSPDVFLKELNTEIIQVLKENTNPYEKVKKACWYLHRDFLDSYGFDYIFPNQINKKLFNCLSSSVIFGHILNKLDFTYKYVFVKEHVYLETVVNGKIYKIETTSKAGFTREAMS